MAAFAGEGPRQAGQVAGGRLGPSFGIGITLVEVHEEAPQGSDVLVVVTHDVHERAWLTEPEVVQVATRNLPTRDVAVPPQAEQL